MSYVLRNWDECIAGLNLSYIFPLLEKTYNRSRMFGWRMYDGFKPVLCYPLFWKMYIRFEPVICSPLLQRMFFCGEHMIGLSELKIFHMDLLLARMYGPKMYDWFESVICSPLLGKMYDGV